MKKDLLRRQKKMLREAKKQGPNFQRLVHEKRPFAPPKKHAPGSEKQGPNFQRLVHEKRPFAPPKNSNALYRKAVISTMAVHLYENQFLSILLIVLYYPHDSHEPKLKIAEQDHG